MKNFNLSIKGLFCALIAVAYLAVQFLAFDTFSFLVNIISMILFALYFSNIIKSQVLNILVKISFTICYLYTLYAVVDSHGLKILGVVILWVGVYSNETRGQVIKPA